MCTLCNLVAPLPPASRTLEDKNDGREEGMRIQKGGNFTEGASDVFIAITAEALKAS